jgi:hypothetical protein
VPAVVPSSAPPAEPTETVLRRRIGRLCHLLRIAAALYALWVLVGLLVLWHDPSSVATAWSHQLRTDLGVVPWGQRLAGLAVCLIDWGFVAGACLSLWRLASEFLAGRIFTVGAASLLRRTALCGLAACLCDILFRPLIFVLLTLHMPPGQRQIGLFLAPNDLLNVVLLGGFLALAEVFRAAAEIADDNARFV